MNFFIEQLRKLAPSGKPGFEGLVAQLLGKLTAQHFYLARSGSQAGRDMSSDRYVGNVIAVECKRYGKSTELSERELLAELVQSIISIPDLDIWVLVTSRDIPDQLFNLLNQYAVEQGIEFRAISTDDSVPSSMEVLCAYGMQITLDFWDTLLSESEALQLSEFLKNTTKNAGFEIALKRLHELFSSANIGYEHWHSQNNKRLIDCFSSENKSRQAFGQVLHVGLKEAHLIKRRKAWQELDEWLSSWGKAQPHLALLGDEGDGKTWAVASWLDWQFKNTENFPTTVFLSSSHPKSNDPASLLSEAIAQQTGVRDTTYWRKRLMRWVVRPAGNGPVILLVLDGINERRSPQWWRKLIEGFMTSPWQEQIAVLITSRTGYWERFFSGLRHLMVRTFEIAPYDDEELNNALKRHDIDRSDIADSLLPLIRKPRYFDLVIKHRERMADCGDITVARIIYEDWRDRWSRKTNLPIDDQDFQSLIKGLASKALRYSNDISEKDVAEQLPLIDDKQAVLNELVSGGILYGKPGSYKVEKHRLILGFGLLLANQIEIMESDPEGSADLTETIASWLEPHQEMDIKASILEAAALHSLSPQGSFLESCQVALLHAWLNSKNPQESSDENFTAYLLLNPKAYLKLAETIWSDAHDNPWGQDLLMRALLHWRNIPTVQSILPETFERWLGFVHPAGYPMRRHEKTEEDVEKITKEIAERAGQHLTNGSIEFTGFSLTVIHDDGLLRLGRVALAIISHIPRKPFLQAIAIGCLAEAIMGFPDKYDLFGWVLRSSPEALWPDIKKQVKSLMHYENIATKQASYRLLSLEGGDYVAKMQEQFPVDLFPPHPFKESHQKDPCNSFFAWNRVECESCLRRTDLDPYLIARKIQLFCRDPKLSVPSTLGLTLATLAERIQAAKIWTNMGLTTEDHFIEEIESALCAFSPEAAAKIYCSIAKTVDDRQGIILRQLVLHLIQHDLILDDEIREKIEKVWLHLIEQPDTDQQHENLVEKFLFQLILPHINATLQLAYLLKRSANVADLLSFERSFKPSQDWKFITQQLSNTETPDIRRTLWFLSRHPQVIPDSQIPSVASCIGHEDSLVRSLALRLLYERGDERSTREFIQSEWAWETSNSSLENHWGSIVWAIYGCNLSYDELRSRIHPSHLGFAVTKRGNNSIELNQYAKDIHRVWQTFAETAPDIPLDFPASEVDCDLKTNDPSFERIGLSDTIFSKSVKFFSRDAFWGGLPGGSSRESVENAFGQMSNEQYKDLMKIVTETVKQQAQAGNDWFSSSFPKHCLKFITEQRHDLVKIWLNGISENDPASKYRLVKGRSFYESLCHILLSTDPLKGVGLYHQLRKAHSAVNFVAKDTGIPVLNYSLFNAPVSPEVIEAWDQYLQECKTDKDLLELVILAQEGDGLSWLESIVQRDLDSDVMFNKARAVLILGLLGTEVGGKWLEQHISPQAKCWIDQVIEKAYLYWQTNTWSQYWFKRFMLVESDIHAWASFRLLLKCVDRRFWGWQKKLQSNMESNDENNPRLIFLLNNEDSLRNSIKKNEKAMADNFLTTKVLDTQAWPWMGV